MLEVISSLGFHFFGPGATDTVKRGCYGAILIVPVLLVLPWALIVT